MMSNNWLLMVGLRRSRVEVQNVALCLRVALTYWCLSLPYSDYARSQVEIIPLVLPLFYNIALCRLQKFTNKIMC